MGKLDGKIALITGGAGGIGVATAQLFHKEGASIVVVDRDEDENEFVADQIRREGGKAIAVHADVSSVDDVKRMINQALDAFRRIDVLFNNAGVGSAPVPIHGTDNDDWDRVINVCLKGVFLGMKYVIPQMMEQHGGTIINMASIAGLIGSQGLAPYAAAKAGVIELTKTAAVEYSKYNIRCNALAPGWVHTPMVEEYIGGDKDREQQMLRGIPMRRFGDVSE
ncbi:MAG TPA: SDR family NAD(P)-dependent oxidoreductase, partial [Aggregatilineales bacterium]|nr:SDR family NAD(P)-dependent oxidoreductase [Aggregatilineales bacterium]